MRQSCLPLKLYKDYDIQMNEIADMLIHRPNPNMSGFEWLNTNGSIPQRNRERLCCDYEGH
ncbi:hypothetical protein [Paenibacillus larvae]|uniref:hypothetical protein n=1 Tax=Paenibacillus larvae TaxID=1464 RepID=UPI0028918FE7|nr:hypothetical protein [Paenibacillus larvae]MDT2193589.1 hypothetical protein [Paenibacillus larvae]